MKTTIDADGLPYKLVVKDPESGVRRYRLKYHKHLGGWTNPGETRCEVVTEGEDNLVCVIAGKEITLNICDAMELMIVLMADYHLGVNTNIVSIAQQVAVLAEDE